LIECHAYPKWSTPYDVTMQPQSVFLHDQREIRWDMDQVGYVQRGTSDREIKDRTRNFRAADFDRCRLREPIAGRYSSLDHLPIPGWQARKIT
jgi:hypothetical protein